MFLQAPASLWKHLTGALSEKFNFVLTFTVWMAPPPRCSLRISITLFSVSVSERRSSRQAATGGQKRTENEEGFAWRSEAPRRESYLIRIGRGLRNS